MRRFVARNKTLLLALTLAVLGAAALGVGFACALERQAETVSPVERENAVPLEAGSAPAGEAGAALPTGAVQDAADAFSRLRAFTELLGLPGLSESYEAEYRECNTASPGEPEKIEKLWILNHHDMPDDTETIEETWATAGNVAPGDADAGQEPLAAVGFTASVNAETGKVQLLSYSEENLYPATEPEATAEQGRAILENPSDYLARAEALVKAMAPGEAVVSTSLGTVQRINGRISVEVFVYTEADETHLLVLSPDTRIAVNTYVRLEGDASPGETALFIDQDADRWIMEYENFDSLEPVSPRSFTPGEAKSGQIGAAEAKRRYAAFYEGLTGVAYTGAVDAQYFSDASGEREDYWALRGRQSGNALNIAVSANTGTLLELEGQTDMGSTILLHPESALEDWAYDGEDIRFACQVLRAAAEQLAGGEGVKEVSLNAMYDKYYLTLDVEFSDGRIVEFLFCVKNGKVLLEEAGVFYGRDAFYYGWMAPWKADIRYVDTDSGEIREGWIGGRGNRSLLG